MKESINRSIFEDIVQESLSDYTQNLVLEGLTRDQIGKNGPISPGDLISPDDIDPNRDFERERDEFCRRIGRRMTDDELEQVFGNSEWYRIWKQYKTAMLRPDDPTKKARGLFGFIEQIKHGKAGMPIKIFKYKDSYILGMLRMISGGNGGGMALFFWPAYFAPATMREGYEAVANLSQYNNIIFTVTDDLSKMLRKLGLYEMPDKFKMKFRGNLVDKELFSTSSIVTNPAVSKLLSTGLNAMGGAI